VNGKRVWYSNPKGKGNKKEKEGKIYQGLAARNYILNRSEYVRQGLTFLWNIRETIKYLGN